MSMDMWNPQKQIKKEQNREKQYSRFYSLPTTASVIELLQVSILCAIFSSQVSDSDSFRGSFVSGAEGPSS